MFDISKGIAYTLNAIPLLYVGLGAAPSVLVTPEELFSPLREIESPTKSRSEFQDLALSRILTRDYLQQPNKMSALA